MTKLEISLLVVVAGLLAYIFFIAKPSEIVVGPSQQELDDFKAKAAIKSDSLRSALASITATRTKDSIRYVSERTNSSKAISYWKKRVSESKTILSDSLPDSTLVIEQAKVIILQDSVIEKQGERIQTDSLYIRDLESNFGRRLANEKQQRELLEQETKLQSGVIEDQKRQIRKHKREKVFIGIAGVVLVILLL